MEFLRSILENSQYSFITAIVLGLMTAISPCPLATNISAIGFISRDIENRHRVFISGIIYTLGRAISYTLLVEKTDKLTTSRRLFLTTLSPDIFDHPHICS